MEENSPEKPKRKHGGKRVGAGRKSKPRAGPTWAAGGSNSTSDTIIPANLSIEERHKFLEGLADETLAMIMATGTSEPARVAAARETLDRIRGKPKPGTAKADQPDMFENDGWGTLLQSKQPAAGRSN